MDNPRCEYCGKFVSYDDVKSDKARIHLVWINWPVPEPSHEVFWHVECESEKGGDGK